MPIWVNPLLLFGAAAGAVPIILHLVMRKRTSLVPFSRLLFMAELPRRSEQHFRLKQLLLLLMRIACLLLLAMAFARPYFEKKAAALSGRAPSALFVLVDVSGSMACQNRLQTVIREVKDRVEALHPGDLVGVAVFDNSPRLLTALTEDRSGALALLESNSKCTYERTDIASALQFGSDMLADVQDRERTLLLASDLQQKGLQRLEEGWKLPPGIELSFINVGNDAQNSCVADAMVLDSNAVGEAAGKPGMVRALVAHHAPSGSASLEVNLEVAGRTVETQTVKLTAGQQRTVDFVLPRSTRATEGCVRLQGDDLRGDDVRHFVIAPNRRERVIVVVNADGSPPKEAVFPAVALGAGEPPQYDVQFVTGEGLTRQELRDLSLVIVPGEVDLNEASAAWLKGYAEGGGTILLGADKKPPDVFAHRAHLADVEPIGWLECDCDATVFQMFADYDVRHPVFAPFRGSRRGNFTAADFTGHERVSPGPTVNVLAAFDDGSPALMERRLGKGRVLLFTSSLGPKWNNLPFRGLYAAFMQSVAGFAGADMDLPDSYLIGATALLWGSAGESASVRSPDGDEAPINFDEKGDAFYRGTTLPGVYTLTGDDPFSFAVNMDPEESDLESLPEEDLSFLVSSAEEDTDTSLASLTGNSPGEESGRATTYWKYLLVALLVLALGETLLANRTYR